MSEWHRPSVYVVCIPLGASMLWGDLGNTGSDASAARLFQLFVRLLVPGCESPTSSMRVQPSEPHTEHCPLLFL